MIFHYLWWWRKNFPETKNAKTWWQHTWYIHKINATPKWNRIEWNDWKRTRVCVWLRAKETRIVEIFACICFTCCKNSDFIAQCNNHTVGGYDLWTTEDICKSKQVFNKQTSKKNKPQKTVLRCDAKPSQELLGKNSQTKNVEKSGRRRKKAPTNQRIYLSNKF